MDHWHPRSSCSSLVTAVDYLAKIRAGVVGYGCGHEGSPRPSPRASERAPAITRRERPSAEERPDRDRRGRGTQWRCVAGNAVNVPEQLRYSTDHEWISRDGEIVRVGITDYAQDALGDVVFVQVPSVGATVDAGESFGEVESTKSVSDVYAPVIRRRRADQRRAGGRAAGAQRRSVRRRLDLHHPDERSRRSTTPCWTPRPTGS